MTQTVYASILHGAYGDYYEQAVCLKHFRASRPDVRMKLFAASPHRLSEMRALDFFWADCFELWTELPKHQIDTFFQFQVRDAELRTGVLSKLPPDVLRKLDSQSNLLPWRYLRSVLPLQPEQQLGLSDFGRVRLEDVLKQNGIAPAVFARPTIGFLWRYRAPNGAVKPMFQDDARRLVEKYSRLLRHLIEEYGCHILVCGMKVPRTAENIKRIDAKFPEYGLDLPERSSTHLKGLSWPLEVEILSRSTLCLVNASGFSEALWIKRGRDVMLLDPPPHYLAKALWRRVPLFDLHSARGLFSAMTSRSENGALRMARSRLEQLLSRQSAAFTKLQKVAP